MPNEPPFDLRDFNHPSNPMNPNHWPERLFPKKDSESKEPEPKNKDEK